MLTDYVNHNITFFEKDDFAVEENEKPKKKEKKEKKTKKDDFEWPSDPDSIVLDEENFDNQTHTGSWVVQFYDGSNPHVNIHLKKKKIPKAKKLITLFFLLINFFSP